MIDFSDYESIQIFYEIELNCEHNQRYDEARPIQLFVILLLYVTAKRFLTARFFYFFFAEIVHLAHLTVYATLYKNYTSPLPWRQIARFRDFNVRNRQSDASGKDDHVDVLRVGLNQLVYAHFFAKLRIKAI